jgi:glyoxylase-like metal-dependent hydrolase (beta-lactamase superfamily II)
MASRISAASGAAVQLGAVETQALAALGTPGHASRWHALISSWKVPPARLDELLTVSSPARSEFPPESRAIADGERLPIPGRDVRALLTPGHTPGHLCFADTRLGVVFTGDHVLPITNSGLGLGGASTTNALVDYLASLARLSRFDTCLALPGHEMPFRDLARRTEQLARRQADRTAEVAAALAAGLASVWDIAGTLTWSAGWQNLTGVHLRSALAQTAMHVDYLRG